MNDFSVLARSNRIADGIRDALGQFGVEHRAKTKREYPDDWRVARTALNLICSPGSESAFERYALAVNPEEARAMILLAHKAQTPLECPYKLTGDADKLEKELKKLRVSKASIEIIAAKFAELPESASLSDLAVALALEKDVETQEGRGVTVTTVHGAKGREWPTVVFAGFEDEVIPGKRKVIDIEEERRIAFVGFTRARERLIITYARARREAWGRRHAAEATASRFLFEANL